MPLILRLGDPGSHGGAVCTAAGRSLAEGVPIARIGDTYCCPLHGGNPIVSGASFTACEGSGSLGLPRVALNGSRSACGATLTATATSTYVE